MKSAFNVMKLTEVLLEDGGELGARELSARTGIPKSTVQRFLEPMVQNGWIFKNSNTQGYRIGYRLMGQCNVWALRLALEENSRDLLRSLCERTQCNAVLSMLDGYQAMWIALSIPEGSKFLAERPKVYALHSSAAGKLLLAWAPPPLRDHILFSMLPSYARNTITDARALMAELEKIRSAGYAQSESESVNKMCELAVPVQLPDGTILAALSLAAQISVLSRDGIQEHLKLLCAAAGELGHRLNIF